MESSPPVPPTSVKTVKDGKGSWVFFLTSGYHAQTVACQVSREGDTWNAEEIFNLPPPTTGWNSEVHTPIFYRDHIYGVGKKQRGLWTCLDLEGNEVWTRHLGSESTRKQWGSASSPILVGDVLVVNASEESRALYGLDKATGKELWKAEAETLGYTYGTPAMRKIGEREDLVLAVPGELWGMNPKTGKLRWYAETGLSGNIAPSVAFHDDLAFVFGDYPKTGRAAIKLGNLKDLRSDSLVWENNHTSYIPTPIS